MKIFRFCFNRFSEKPNLDELTEEDLKAENVGFEDFAKSVLHWLEKDGVYDDSDYPDTVCIYFKGTDAVEAS